MKVTDLLDEVQELKESIAFETSLINTPNLLTDDQRKRMQDGLKFSEERLNELLNARVEIKY